MAKAITARSVELIKPTEARKEVADAVVPGLYLVIQKTGAKSWAVRYRLGRKSFKLTLGPYPLIDLNEAREQARRALHSVARGNAPERMREDLFETIAEQFVERHAKQRRNWREVERQLRNDVLPAWGQRRIGDITRRDVIELLDAIVDRGAGIQANRTLALVRKLFNWAVSRDIIAASPVVGVKAPTQEVSRDRVLTDAELARFWRAAATFEYPFGPLLQMLALTGQRLSEVAEAQWSELDLDRRLSVIPKERAKNNTAHEVPLAPQVVDLLGALPRIAGGLVFTTTGTTPVSGFSRVKARLDAAIGEMPHWRFHDLRRSAASGMARLGINLPVIEKVLNHTSGSFAGIVGVYQHHSFSNEKRAALEAWARHVEALTADRPTNVVPLRGSAS